MFYNGDDKFAKIRSISIRLLTIFASVWWLLGFTNYVGSLPIWRLVLVSSIVLLLFTVLLEVKSMGNDTEEDNMEENNVEEMEKRRKKGENSKIKYGIDNNLSNNANQYNMSNLTVDNDKNLKDVENMKNQKEKSIDNFNAIESVEDSKIALSDSVKSSVLDGGLSADKIKVYASVDDGQKHGWVFDEKVAIFDNKPIFNFAKLGDKVWVFDGLVHDKFNAVIDKGVRIFGRLRYKLIDDDNLQEILAT